MDPVRHLLKKNGQPDRIATANLEPRNLEPGTAGLQQRASQHHERDREIDHQPGDVHERRDKRRRRRRRIEAEPPQHERQQRSAQRAPQHDADQRDDTVIATSSQCGP